MFDILAIDWGLVRTGLSFASTETGLAIPYNQELMTSDLLKIIDKEVKNKSIKVFVLGKPTNFKLQNTRVTDLIESFRIELQAIYPNIPIVFINENNSSKSAVNIKNKHTINHHAALEIARRYLES
jgi:RNase H-fold protein (predicted Holliday junction resolvase)